MQKRERQEIIAQIILETDVETQGQLLEELEHRGIQATQATISRDIKEMNLMKELSPSGLHRYAVSRGSAVVNFTERLHKIFKEGVTSFDLAQNIVILKTMPGLASAACVAIDHMEIPELVGSLAGDDTALLIMRTNEGAMMFCDEINRMLK